MVAKFAKNVKHKFRRIDFSDNVEQFSTYSSKLALAFPEQVLFFERRKFLTLIYFFVYLFCVSASQRSADEHTTIRCYAKHSRLTVCSVGFCSF
jgi:hypothetical protein